MNNKITVLMVDDNQSVSRTFARILEKGGYAIDLAETGEEAIKKLEENSYAVALIDLHLSDMDGIKLIEKMPRTEDTVKIIITGLQLIELGNKTSSKELMRYC